MYIPHLVCPFTCWWTPGVFSPFGYCKLHCHTNICLSKGFPFLWVYTQRWNSWVASQLVLVVKNLPANAGELGDVDFSPGSGRSHGEGHSNPLQDSCLENPMDRGAWWAIVHRVSKSSTWLKGLSMDALSFLLYYKFYTSVGSIASFILSLDCVPDFKKYVCINWCIAHILKK